MLRFVEYRWRYWIPKWTERRAQWMRTSGWAQSFVFFFENPLDEVFPPRISLAERFGNRSRVKLEVYIVVDPSPDPFERVV